jgi:SAM-dependent methyltransferase
MVTSDAALLDTREAFDGVAPHYHDANVANPVLSAMRARAMDAIRAHMAAGSSLLDLGCGPGTDVVHLAGLGYGVTGVDVSPAMVREARRRIEAERLGGVAQALLLDIEHLEELTPVCFDGAYSNLGPFNCVADLQVALACVAARLRPGGVLVASVIGRICPWEILVFALRRDWPRLRVRFARDRVPVPLGGRTVWTRYWTPAQFLQVSARAGFVPVEVRALGLFAPPPYLEGFAARHPRLVDRLQRIDDAIGGTRICRWAGDHFLAVLRRAA